MTRIKFRSNCPFSPNTPSTSSPSSLRNNPWSTNTHVNCFPMALDNNPAATDESTPPDKASNTFPSPTFSRTSLIVFSTKESIFHVPAQPQILRTKL